MAWPWNYRGSLLVCMMAVLFVLGSSAKNAPERKRGTLTASFVCPDPEATQACHSWAELLNAHDRETTSEQFVCFRKTEDQFFTVHLLKGESFFESMKDSSLSEMPDEGFVSTYINGVQDSVVAPNLHFSGKWSRSLGTFTSETVNDGHDLEAGVFISGVKVAVRYSYRNGSNDLLLYSLTIQRSTMRFTERVVMQSRAKTLIEGTGRCSYHQPE